MPRYQRQGVHRWKQDEFVFDNDMLANEGLVHLHVNGKRLTSLLASHEDLVELGVGHVTAEYQSFDPALIDVEVEYGKDEAKVDMHGPFDVENWTTRGRVVTTSCGACEHDALPAMLATSNVVNAVHPVRHMHSIEHAFQAMKSSQDGFRMTGGLHAAGLLYEGDAVRVMEDIGRHNAVDKIIGAHVLSNEQHEPHVLLLSGRCGWDIVAKASRFNIPIIASIGAASSLAATAARASNITLVSFLRDGKAVIIGPLKDRIKAKD